MAEETTRSEVLNLGATTTAQSLTFDARDVFAGRVDDTTVRQAVMADD